LTPDSGETKLGVNRAVAVPGVFMKVKHILAVLFLAVVALGWASSSFAASRNAAVTVKAGTLGLGADVTFKVAPLVHLRLTGQMLDYERSDSVDGVPYDFEAGLQSFGTLVDVHPFGGSFRVTGGLLSNGNEVDAVARLDPTDTYEIGDVTYTGAELGALRGNGDFASTAPFLAVGWGNPFDSESRFGFACDLGVMRQGSADVSLFAENPLGIPGVDQELLKEERELEDDLEDYEYYPVISVGLSIRL
jgi:hypothetical protein